MARLHLFELADHSWWPRPLADAGTAYLATLQQMAKVGDALTPLVRRALGDQQRIVDLASGGTGPVLDLDLGVPVLLTDLQPNTTVAGLPDGVTTHPEPVDARDVPAALTGLRTMFNALHHLRPEDARAVLADAQAKRQPILVVELSERSLLALTVATAFIPLMVLLVMPMVRPVRPLWLLCTYVFPVLPWAIAWDGWVSHWRTYSLAEQEALVAPLVQEGWVWEMGREKVGPGHATWLLGRPT